MPARTEHTLAPETPPTRSITRTVVEFSAQPWVRFSAVATVAVVLIALYLLTAVPGSLDYALKLRGRTVLTMVAVAAAVGVSTVVFQTITNNRILTPGIMGFDSLFLLSQTFVVFAFGSFAFSTVNSILLWLVEVVVMVFFAGMLFGWLFRGGSAARSVHLLLLVGVVFGVFFRSLSQWMQRMIDPTEFAVLQDAFFANFARRDESLLVATLMIVALAIVALIPLLPTLDVLLLGEPVSIGLGVRHRTVIRLLFALVAVMVAATTALAGPVLFFGLVVAHLGYIATGSFRHRHILPMAVVIGIICLVGGQFVLERLFSLQTTLSVIVEFVGGVLFLFLVLRKGAR